MTRGRALGIRIAIAGVAAIAGGLLALAAPRPPDGAPRPPGGAAPAFAPDDPLSDLLGGIDYVPARPALDAVLGDAPASALLALAAADSPADPGVRLRALRALAQYPDPAVAAALAQTVVALRTRSDGVDLLYLDAAMMSLATVAGADAVDVLGPVLDHGVKDVRAAAARALGATGSNAAAKWLHERYVVEPDEMVRLALSDALRTLGAAGTGQ